MTLEEFEAALKLPDGAKVEQLYFVAPEGEYSGHVTAVVSGNSLASARLAAEAAVDVFKGKEVFLRSGPKAESMYLVDEMGWRHRGYVRFSFFDREGEVHEVSDEPMLGLARAELR